MTENEEGSTTQPEAEPSSTTQPEAEPKPDPRIVRVKMAQEVKKSESSDDTSSESSK